MPSGRKVVCMDRQPKWLTRILSRVKLASRSSYTVQRSDGMSWMGSDYRHGTSFTNVERWICRFENKRSALAAVKASGLDKWLESNKDGRIALHANGGAITVENDGTVTFVKVPKN
jgi:hypothetical protein